MKKAIGILAFGLILLFTACGKEAGLTYDNFKEQPGSQEPDESTDEPYSQPVHEKIPLWAQEHQTGGELYQGLNLDGVGDADDEVYVSVYEFGDFEDKITVMRIHLGTGETMAKVFPVYGNFSLQTGRLFSENKDALILEIKDPTSNYGAANIFVVDVFAVGEDPVPSTVVRLDTTTIPAALIFDGRTLDFEAITSGTKVIDIEGMLLQGLEVYAVGPNGDWKEIRNTLYWTDAGWSIISGK